ncbi:MAG: hypothetical protein ACO3S5_10835, partial [Ilumatobacteraceae bacterium]
APKSNRVATAIWDARRDVREGAVGEVPAHLRDAHYSGAAALGHGVGYDYPHDHPDGWVRQQYLPDGLVDRSWYRPSEHGFEAQVGRRLAALGIAPNREPDDIDAKEPDVQAHESEQR